MSISNETMLLIAIYSDDRISVIGEPLFIRGHESCIWKIFAFGVQVFERGALSFFFYWSVLLKVCLLSPDRHRRSRPPSLLPRLWAFPGHMGAGFGLPDAARHGRIVGNKRRLFREYRQAL